MNEVHDTYYASDADRTVALYKRLEACGPRGIIAMNLLRACKASSRAKQYRGGNGRGSYRAQAYDKKDWSLTQLVRALAAFDLASISWGWGRDDQAVGFEDILYVDLPEFGQISFHNRSRIEPESGKAPNYAKPWDGARGLGSSRIIRFACAVLGDPQPEETQGERDVRLKGGSKGSAAAPSRATKESSPQRDGRDPKDDPLLI